MIALGWKEKEHRKKQKDKITETNSNPKDTVWEIEMLRLQGLHRCEKCEEIYRLHEDTCEHCEAPNSNFHSIKN